MLHTVLCRPEFGSHPSYYIPPGHNNSLKTNCLSEQLEGADLVLRAKSVSRVKRSSVNTDV